MKAKFKFVLVIISLCWISVAHATLFRLDNVHFDDGTTAQGQIYFSDGIYHVTIGLFDNAGSTLFVASQATNDFADQTSQRYTYQHYVSLGSPPIVNALQLLFGMPLNDPSLGIGDTVSILQTSSYGFNAEIGTLAHFLEPFDSHGIEPHLTVIIPEPPMLLLIGIAVIGWGLAAYQTGTKISRISASR